MPAGPDGSPPAGLDLIWLRPPRKPRGQRPPLSREQITRAAIELADSRGLESVSTRNIATRLQAAAASLYWHVPSVADLHELMFDAIIGEIALPAAPSADWRADLRAIAHGTRGMFLRHPWAILLGIQPGLGPNTRRYAQAALAALGGLSADPALLVDVLALLNNYLFGFAHREAAWQQASRASGLDAGQWAARLQRYLERDAAQDPAAAPVLSARLHLASDQSFEFGLECLLDGIAARLGPLGQGGAVG
jgi:AcrR family transcriptional regulator